MRPQRAHGRPATHVIGRDWAAGHTAAVTDTLDATITIALPGQSPGWNATTRQTETVAAPAIYAGPAEVSTSSLGGAAQRVDAVDEQVDVSRYSVTLPHDTTGITATHRITVTTCPGDPDLVGRTLRIDEVHLGSTRFARHLTCTLI